MRARALGETARWQRRVASALDRTARAATIATLDSVVQPGRNRKAAPNEQTAEPGDGTAHHHHPHPRAPGNNVQALGLHQLESKVYNEYAAEAHTDFDPHTVPPIEPSQSRTWCVGTVVFVGGSLLNFASYTLAAQSLLASLEAIQFVSNLVFGKFVHHNVVTRKMVVGTLLIMCGVLLTISSSSSCEASYDVQGMIELYYNPVYQVRARERRARRRRRANRRVVRSISLRPRRRHERGVGPVHPFCALRVPTASQLFLFAIVVGGVVLYFVQKTYEAASAAGRPMCFSSVVEPCAFATFSALFGTQSVVQARRRRHRARSFVCSSLLLVTSSHCSVVLSSLLLFTSSRSFVVRS